jgi:hypothetical protein
VLSSSSQNSNNTAAAAATIIIITKIIGKYRNYTDYVHMEFKLEQCANILLNKGESVHSQKLILGISREVQKLQQGKTNRYLWN